MCHKMEYSDLKWKFSFPWYFNGSWKIKITPHHFHGGKWNNTSNTMKLSLKSHDTDLYEQKPHEWNLDRAVIKSCGPGTSPG